MRLFRLLLFLSLIILLIWVYGFWQFQSSIRITLSKPEQKADAIIVLTGGSLRVQEGMRLLQDGYAPLLFISGVGKGVTLSELLDSRDIPMPEDPILLERITMGYQATSTQSNAEEIAAWLADHPTINTVLLITSNYHMPRSFLELDYVLPHITFIPHAVIPNHVKMEEWWRYPGTRTLLTREYHKYLITAIHHRIEQRH